MRHILAAYAAVLVGLTASAVAAQAPPPLPAAMMVELVTANHILVEEGIIDVRGHVSVRDPSDPNHFWITRAVAPGLATAADMQEFDLDGKQVGGAPGEQFTERFIHARIYKARPDVKSIVHGHTPSLTLFSVSGIPLRPVMLGGVFAGDGVPIHVNGKVAAGIHDAPVGDDLARVLGNKAAVLMRGHGAVIVGPSIRSAVGRAVGLDENARMQIQLLSMGAKPDYITPPPGAAADAGNYDREWSWWAHKVAAP